MKFIEIDKKGNRRVRFKPVGPSCTKQEFVKDCDIKNLVRKHLAQGTIQSLAVVNPKEFGTFDQEFDYAQAMTMIGRARAQFDSLPVEIRNKLGNDPRKLLAYVHKPDEELISRREALKYGLIQAPAPEKIQKVKVIKDDDSK